MGFLNGRVSFERLEVSGREFKTFNQDHIDHLEKHAIGKTGAITVDGTEVGFLVVIICSIPISVSRRTSSTMRSILACGLIPISCPAICCVLTK